jgi:AraC-like DNA-binding protein
MFCVPTGIVRAEWSYELAAACQRFAGDVLEPEPQQLMHAVDTFAAALPVPHSDAERLMLRDRLRIATDSAAHQFHVVFHRRVRDDACAWHGPRQFLDWYDIRRRPHDLLGDWVSRYLQVFEISHEWTAPTRAAGIIRMSFGESLDVDHIARAAGCGRSSLMRSFKDVYGMSMREYQTHCRIRAAFNMLREADSKVEAAALLVGYRSTKNFYRALRELTGMTPSSVRQLSARDAAQMLETVLQLPAAKFGRSRSNANGRNGSSMSAPTLASRRRIASRSQRSQTACAA